MSATVRMDDCTARLYSPRTQRTEMSARALSPSQFTSPGPNRRLKPKQLMDMFMSEVTFSPPEKKTLARRTRRSSPLRPAKAIRPKTKKVDPLSSGQLKGLLASMRDRVGKVPQRS